MSTDQVSLRPAVHTVLLRVARLRRCAFKASAAVTAEERSQSFFSVSTRTFCVIYVAVVILNCNFLSGSPPQFTQIVRPAKSVYVEQSERG